jgi:hypothetical protein
VAVAEKVAHKHAVCADAGSTAAVANAGSVNDRRLNPSGRVHQAGHDVYDFDKAAVKDPLSKVDRAGLKDVSEGFHCCRVRRRGYVGKVRLHQFPRGYVWGPTPSNWERARGKLKPAPPVIHLETLESHGRVEGPNNPASGKKTPYCRD